MRKDLAIAEALNIILDSIAPLPAVRMSLVKAANRVLAEKVIASDDVPFNDNSAMDGFAVRVRELDAATETEPVALRLVDGMVAAGDARPTGLSHGTTIRIMTGAVIPPGADGVVPVEEAQVKDGQVRFSQPVMEGRHIRRAGLDLAAGAVALVPGTVLNPGELGVAAVAGRSEVMVVRPPRVALLTSGDELIAPEAPMSAGKVRNANGPVLTALLAAAGAEVIDMGILPDDRLAIAEAVDTARRADVIVTSGGVSMGERDFIRAVLEEQGMKEKFWRVDVKPGRPLLFGMIGGVPVFGLPGNPVSAAVTFELFVRPAILKMQGHTRVFRPMVEAHLDGEIRRSPGRPEFVRVHLERQGAGSPSTMGYVAALTRPAQGSAILTSMLGANAFLFLEADTVAVPRGATVPCVLLEEPLAESFILPRN